jgi:beta-galactosidase GanA
LKKTLAGLLMSALAWSAQASDIVLDAPLPRIVHKDGRHALLVDDKPFFMLGAQVNNSSAWPAQMPLVWPAIDRLGANTLEVPIAWEQIETAPGTFDFDYLDLLLAQARTHGVRLVLLWFGTWKNNGPSYTPAWIKLDNARYPRVVDAKGELKDSLSPIFAATLAADRAAFVALMRHIRENDPQHTVVMMQIENETGTYGSARDHSPQANRLFAGEVPAPLLKARGRTSGTWTEVFGKEADEAFHAWYIARFADDVAAAGKAELDLPMYVNVALRDPFKRQEPTSYSAGGPTDNVIDVWKAGAPHIDAIGPDIYFAEDPKYRAVLTLYDRPDNPLFVPETGHGFVYARYLFDVMGRRGIGFAPFGVDFTNDANDPAAIPNSAWDRLEPFASNYHLVAPIMRVWAQQAFDGQVWGASEPDDRKPSDLDLGRWHARVHYDKGTFGASDWTWMKPRPANPQGPEGGVLVAALGPDEYLVTGRMARIDFSAPAGSGYHAMLARVEEGRFDEAGKWVLHHVWNGDQTDYGVNFTTVPRVLKVKLGSYPARQP